MVRIGLSLFLLFWVSSAAADLVTGIRGEESNAATFAKQNEFHVISTRVKEFDNSNTFVQFLQSVEHQRVIVILPSIMNSNQLMEALLQIRTAYTLGAHEVLVKLDSSISELRWNSEKYGPKVLEWQKLFQIAGADSIIADDKKVELNSVVEKKRVLVKGEGYITGDRHPELTKQLGQSLSLRDLPKNLESQNIDPGTVVYVSAIGRDANESVFETVFDVGNLKSKGHSVILFSPYLHYARSDKVDQPGIVVGGRLVADVLESSNADVFSFVRAHVPQSQGFFRKPQFQISSHKTINSYLESVGTQMIIAPDSGSEKDNTTYSKELRLPLGVINKYRDPVTGEVSIVGFRSPESVKGKIVAIVDDETASGKTLAQAAEYLVKLGALRVVAVVTHLTGDSKNALNSPFLSEIVVTDTIPVLIKHPKLKVLSIASEASKSFLRWVKTPEQYACYKFYSP